MVACLSVGLIFAALRTQECIAITSTTRIDRCMALNPARSTQFMLHMKHGGPSGTVPMYTRATFAQGNFTQQSPGRDLLKQIGISIFGIAAMAIGTVVTAEIGPTDSTTNTGWSTSGSRASSTGAAANTAATSTAFARSYYVQGSPISRPLPWGCPVRAH
jgi:hypothetical protein